MTKRKKAEEVQNDNPRQEIAPVVVEINHDIACQHNGCDNDATTIVKLGLRAKPEGPMALTGPVCYLCDEHKNVEWNEVVDERGWKQILRSFIDRKLQTPIQEYSELVFRPISENPLVTVRKPKTSFSSNRKTRRQG